MERLRFEFSGHQRDYILDKDRLVIGRSEDVDVTLVTATMSRSHFEIAKESEGWVVRDLESSNGTMLNTVKLGKPALKLTPGDVITAGGLQFTFSPPASEGQSVKGTLDVLGEGDVITHTAPLYLAASIGRGAENDLVISDPQVSTHHCAVELRAGTPMLRDLGSTNGTLYKGEKITERSLNDGDIFFLGLGFRVRLTMLVPTGPEVVQAAAAEDQSVRPTAHVPAPEEIPGIPIASSFVLILLFIAVGFGLAIGLPKIVGDVPVDEGSSSKGPIAAPTTTALGFDEGGALGGWSIVEARGAGAKAGLDGTNSRQGKASLVLTLSGPTSSVAVETEEPQDLALGNAGTFKAWVKGKAGASTAVLVSAIFADGEQAVLGQSDLSRQNLGDWSQLSIKLLARRPVNTAKLRLEVVGSASALWIDGITVDPDAKASPIPPSTLVSGSVRGTMNNGPSVRVMADGGKGPVEVSTMFVARDGVVQDDVWMTDRSTGDASKLVTNWLSGRGRGTAASCELTMVTVSDPYLGVSIEFRPVSDATPVIKFTTSIEGGLVLYDYVGNPIPVTTAPHMSVGSVSGLTIGGMHIMAATSVAPFARVVKLVRGWEVWLNYPSLSAAATIKFEVHSLPVMDYVRHTKLLEEVDRLAPSDAPQTGRVAYYGSAALERAKYLEGLSNLIFPGIPAKASSKIREITARADAHWSLSQANGSKARDAATRGSTAEARTLASNALAPLGRIIEEFPGFENMVAVLELRDEMGRIAAGGAGGPAPVNPSDANQRIRGAQPERPTDPSLLARAATTAASLVAQAETARREGKWLMAHLLADNVAFNLHYTPSARAAQDLKLAIEADWLDDAARKAFIDPIMLKMREAERAAERSEARRLAHSILARYPYCEEALELRALLIALGD